MMPLALTAVTHRWSHGRVHRVNEFEPICKNWLCKGGPGFSFLGSYNLMFYQGITRSERLSGCYNMYLYRIDTKERKTVDSDQQVILTKPYGNFTKMRVYFSLPGDLLY